jgi:molecular chaperone DnaJ
MKLDRYYRTLGVTGNEDVRVIKQAFMRVAQKYHPDKNPDDVKSTEKFIDARNAYEHIMKHLDLVGIRRKF